MLNDFRNFKFSSNYNNNSSTCQAEKLDTLTPSQTKIMNKILLLGNRCTYVYPNQTTLGREAGVTRRQTNRIIKQLCEWGLLEKLTRPNLTCVYRVPQFFLDPINRQRYKDKFSAFRWLSLVLLFCPLLSLGVSRTIIVNRFIYKPFPPFGREGLTDSSRRVGVYSSEARSKVILELTRDLNLNKRGQIKLSPYPFECLTYAQGRFKEVKNPRDSFAFFLSLCNKWCDMNDIRPDWKAKFELLRQSKMEDEGNVYGERTSFKQQEYYKSDSHREGFQKGERSNRSTPAKPVKEWEREYVKPFDMRELLANQKAQAQKIREEGNEEWAQKLECEITKERPEQYRMALHVARSAPAFMKEDWIKMLVTDPDIISEPVRQAIREYTQGNASKEEPSAFTALAQAVERNHQEMLDDTIWEEVDVPFDGDILTENNPEENYETYRTIST